MEYVFSLRDGRRTVVYDDNNDVYLAVCGPGRNVKLTKLINDYHSSLRAISYRSEIFLAYISYAREIVVESLIKEEKIVLFQDSSDILNIRALSFLIVQDKIFLICLMDISEKETVMRCYELYDERKKRDIINCDGISLYNAFVIGEHNILWIENEAGIAKYYEILLSEKKEIILKELNIDTKENVTNITESAKKQEIELREKIGNIKKEYNIKLRDELEKQREVFKLKYDELVETTREIQNEGKRWRKLYYDNVNNNYK